MSNELQQGTIVFYSPAKQFGFIRQDGAEVGKDIFFDIEQYEDAGDPVIDTRVAFTVEADPRREGRRRAKAVVPVSQMASAEGTCSGAAG